MEDTKQEKERAMKEFMEAYKKGEFTEAKIELTKPQKELEADTIWVIKFNQ